MNWTLALANETVVLPRSCALIIVGETKEGSPFCYEDGFTLLKASAEELTVTLDALSIHPLEKLHHVCFIEFSFREQGILYYALVDLLHMETKRNVCTLTLTAPLDLKQSQKRRYPRMALPTRTPVTSRIVGVREQISHQNVAFTGQILDLSGGGMAFMTSTRVFCPLELELSFVLPGIAQKITVYGEIVRVAHFSSDAYRVAVRFHRVPDSTAALMEEYCSASGTDS